MFIPDSDHDTLELKRIVIEVADKTEILADKNSESRCDRKTCYVVTGPYGVINTIFDQVPTAQSAHCAFSIDIDDMVLKPFEYSFQI
jgi:hypothetical protein